MPCRIGRREGGQFDRQGRDGPGSNDRNGQDITGQDQDGRRQNGESNDSSQALLHFTFSSGLVLFQEQELRLIEQGLCPSLQEDCGQSLRRVGVRIDGQRHLHQLLKLRAVLARH